MFFMQLLFALAGVLAGRRCLEQGQGLWEWAWSFWEGCRSRSHHSFSITTTILPPPPRHPLGSGSSHRDSAATGGHWDGQYKVSMLTPLLTATHSPFTTTPLF